MSKEERTLASFAEVLVQGWPAIDLGLMSGTEHDVILVVVEAVNCR